MRFFVPRWLQAGVLLAISVSVMQAQLVTTVTSIPDTGKPPVVLVNGYQSDCPASFRGTFGTADEVLQRNGEVSLFFDSCTVPDRPSIEALGNAFGNFLRSLRYQDGRPVAQVDVAAHSMGGLIVRSYLAGKQQEEGVFTPPAETRIRKLVFLGTPHFGTAVTSFVENPDIQLREITPGSQFLFDLATWNQGIEDFRGTDAIAVLGNAGTSFGGPARFHDSTVNLTSGSLEFALPGRTRIINYCHTGGIAALACSPGVERLADISSDSHDTARIFRSFFNGTEEWRSIGESPEQNTYLRSGGGLALRWRDANDRPITLRTASVTGQAALTIRPPAQIGVADLLPGNPLQLTLESSTGSSATYSLPAFTGGTRAITLKSGPLISAVLPIFAAVTPRSVAPGMFVSIYGAALASATMEAPGLTYPVSLAGTEVRAGNIALPLQYVSPAQINAVLPELPLGLSKLTVRSAAGEHTVNVVVESVAPALFSGALNAVTGAPVTSAAPLRPGDYVSLYLTGLGATAPREGLNWAIAQPQVTIGGYPCELLYAGRAPGFNGLDQINCRVSPDTPANLSSQVVVRSGNRFSNVILLAIR